MRHVSKKKKKSAAESSFCVASPLSNEIPKGPINRKTGWQFSCCTSVAIACGKMWEPKIWHGNGLKILFVLSYWGFKLLHHNVLFAHSSSLIYSVSVYRSYYPQWDFPVSVYVSGCCNWLFSWCLICWQNLTSRFHTFIRALLLLLTLLRDLLRKNQCEVKYGALRDYLQAMGTQSESLTDSKMAPHELM